MPCRHFPQSPTAIIRSLSCHPITFSCETCSVDPVTQTISKSVPNSIAYLHTAIKQLLFYTPTTMPEQLQSCNKNIKNLIIDLERFPRISQLEFFCNTSTIHPFLGYFFVICSYRKKYNPLLTSTIVSHCRKALMNAPNSSCLLFFPIKQPPITCIQFLSTTCQLEVIAIHPHRLLFLLLPILHGLHRITFAFVSTKIKAILIKVTIQNLFKLPSMYFLPSE